MTLKIKIFRLSINILIYINKGKLKSQIQRHKRIGIAQSEEEKIAAGFLTYHTRPYHDILRGMGCTVVNWDPIEESFAHALQRQKVSG